LFRQSFRKHTGSVGISPDATTLTSLSFRTKQRSPSAEVRLPASHRWSGSIWARRSSYFSFSTFATSPGYIGRWHSCTSEPRPRNPALIAPHRACPPAVHRNALAADLSSPYHEDERIAGRTLINVWAPFDPCGEDAPRLEVVLGTHAALLPTSGEGNNVDRSEIQPKTLDTFAQEIGRCAPIFNPGDVILFSGRTVHRTSLRLGMTKPRMSAELRFE
jgi:hypothetical protein